MAIMSDLLKLFPVGGTIVFCGPTGFSIRYGSDGMIFVRKNWLVTGDPYAVRKIIDLFRRKKVSFDSIKKDNKPALLINA